MFIVSVRAQPFTQYILVNISRVLAASLSVCLYRASEWFIIIMLKRLCLYSNFVHNFPYNYSQFVKLTKFLFEFI